jgi:DNA-binding CsgD family transcriptional regulator
MSLSTSAAARLAAVLSALKGLGVTARETHLRVLREALDSDPYCMGVWSIWEPDALDGDDSARRNAPCHDDSGRFKPWWHRRSGKPRFEISQDHDDPILGRYYQQPCLKRAPVLIAPYRYPMQGGPALLATVSAPIMVAGNCVGAAGIDYALDTMAQEVVQCCEDATLRRMNSIADELQAGLVVLDERGRMVAGSSATSGMLRSIGFDALQPGQDWDGRLTPQSASSSGMANEITVQHRDVAIMASSVAARRGEPTVVVLTKTFATAGCKPLSSREDEVMRWLSEGKSNEEIGIILSISAHTVKNHLDRIYRKIGVDNRHAAMLTWGRMNAVQGLLPATL